MPELPEGAVRHSTTTQDHGLDKALDNTLIQLAEGALEDGRPVTLELPIRNVNRTVGTLLGYEVTRRYGGEGLPDNTIDVTFTGSAGQSFGAFVPRGITLRLLGDANDYVGKGLSGGRISVRPALDAPLVAEDNLVAGNVLLYGATAGEAYFRGIVGERFCVRNSGRDRSGRGRRRPRLRVHDGWPAWWCWAVQGATSRLACPVASPTCSTSTSRGSTREMVDARDRMEDDDLAFLHQAVSQHFAETQSAVAERLLGDWDNVRSTASPRSCPGTISGCWSPCRPPGKQALRWTSQ